MEENEPEVDHGHAQAAQVDCGECEQQDAEDDERDEKREHGAPTVEQESEDDGNGEYVWAEALHL